MTWMTSGEMCEELKISKTSLMNYSRTGLVEVKKIGKGKQLYRLPAEERDETDKIDVFYARVSNTKMILLTRCRS